MLARHSLGPAWVLMMTVGPYPFNLSPQPVAAALPGLTNQAAPGADSLAAGVPTPFTEEAVARGINYYTPGRASIEGFGYGLAFADLDGDRDPDIVVMGQTSGLAGIYENIGGGMFNDRSAGNGIPVLDGRSGVVALDYDADGDLDLFFTQIDYPNVLVRNDGNFQFTDVSAAAGVNHTGRGTGAAVGDYDGDGWLDIHVPNYGSPDRLYRNLGNGTYTDMAPTLGVADPWRGWQSVFFDMDFDGDADLYVSNDKKVAVETQMHNRLYENIGGTFSDISTTSGTDANIYSMGLGVGDFDGNGLQDVYCTNLAVEPNYLFLNQGAGLFASSASLTGSESFRTGWGAVIFDYDNDGHQDLYVCNMAGPPIGAMPQNRLYVHAGAWPCVDQAAALKVDDAKNSFAVAVADIEGDGDLDLLVQNNDDQIRLYVNHEGEKRNWIKFDVVGQGNNVFAVGAHVSVRVGSTWRHREIIAGGNNFKSQNELLVHVGLDAAVTTDQISINWPGGTTRGLTGYGINQTWSLYPPEKLGDFDQNATFDGADTAGFADCLTGHQPGAVTPGCEMMDFQGDADVDLRDFGLYQTAYAP